MRESFFFINFASHGILKYLGYFGINTGVVRKISGKSALLEIVRHEAAREMRVGPKIDMISQKTNSFMEMLPKKQLTALVTAATKWIRIRDFFHLHKDIPKE